MSITQNIRSFKHNQSSLQYLGNVVFHQHKSTTSYDSVNALTTPNNHYTLLYPDLVQELFNFSLHNSNTITNISHSLGSLDKNIHKYSSLDASLSPRDILFFLQIVSLYQLELSKGNASIIYPSLKLAKLLGVDASCDDVNVLGNANMRSSILKMTAKLESLGLLKVFRSKRRNGMDLANKLIPVLPDRLHTRIKDSPSNLKVSDSSKLKHESNLEHILRTKLFVPIELDFMKSLFKNNLPSKYKLFFLNCIMSAYRNFRQNSSDSNMLSFAATSSELIQKNNISYSTLKRIFRYIKQQGDSFFLQVEHKYTKSDNIDSNRYDKSIFVISINPLVFPISQIKPPKEEITEFNHHTLPCSNSLLFPDTYRVCKTGGSKKQPSRVKKTALNNKEEIIKNKYNRNIDYIDEKSEEEFLEDKPCLSSSKSYNNSSFLNDLGKNTVLKKSENQEISVSRSTHRDVLEQGVQNKEQSIVQHNKQNTKRTELAKSDLTHDKAQWQELRNFYPLSKQDISLLNSRANREFSNNFVNQLLLKLYIKYPEKRFKNRFTFLSYMVQILQNEKHQGPLVNHTTFRFSCNIGTQEKNILEYEKYLNEIEHSFDTSKEIQLKKKISGRFSTEIAYKILTQVEFKTNAHNSLITALIPSCLDLSERQIAILSEQLEAVYGINGYYVQDVEEKIPLPKSKTSDIDFNGTPIDILGGSSEIDMIEENTTWHKIRKGLIEELGEAIDTAWFSKAVVKECSTTSKLTITMPTRFMSDFIKSRYSYAISRIAMVLGVMYIEYKSL